MLGGLQIPYSEVTGVVTLTKAFNPGVMTWAAIFAILLAFIGKLGGVLASIPMPVMGGVMVLLFGLITTVGISVLIKAQNRRQQPKKHVYYGNYYGCWCWWSDYSPWWRSNARRTLVLLAFWVLFLI